MKNTILLFFFISVFMSCKKEIKTINNTKDIVENNNSESENAVKTLKKFYLLFYGTDDINNNEKLMRKYVSKRILDRMDSLRSDNENLILDYDPFIKAQDYDANVIRKTLKIEPLKIENKYRVSFLLFEKKSEERTNVDIQLKKDENGNFLIYNILNDRYLNFNNSSKISVDKKSLGKWYGIYLNTDTKELIAYDSIIKNIGWFKLSVKPNQIIFENDERMESEFPTEAPGGYHINYKCDFKIIGDTLKLYEKTINVNTLPNENISTNIKPVLILYKKNNRYYGISSDISNSENLINAIRVKGKPPYIFTRF